MNSGEKLHSLSDSSGTEINRRYYESLTPGREAYWKYMAASLFRRHRLRQLVQRQQPASIADFGCGNGALLHELTTVLPGTTGLGVDLSTSQIAMNRERYPHLDWLALDLAQPEVRLPRGVDLIVSSEVIEHIDAPGLYLQTALKNLLPGGMLILTTQSGPIRFTERHVGHLRHWPAAELSTLLRATGFTEVSAWHEGFPFHDLSKALANVRPEQTIAAFGTREWGIGQRMACLILRLLFQLNSASTGAQVYATAHAPRSR